MSFDFFAVPGITGRICAKAEVEKVMYKRPDRKPFHGEYTDEPEPRRVVEERIDLGVCGNIYFGDEEFTKDELEKLIRGAAAYYGGEIRNIEFTLLPCNSGSKAEKSESSSAYTNVESLNERFSKLCTEGNLSACLSRNSLYKR